MVLFFKLGADIANFFFSRTLVLLERKTDSNHGSSKLGIWQFSEDELSVPITSKKSKLTMFV